MKDSKWRPTFGMSLSTTWSLVPKIYYERKKMAANLGYELECHMVAGSSARGLEDPAE
jgi:hypothetical protein